MGTSSERAVYNENKPSSERSPFPDRGIERHRKTFPLDIDRQAQPSKLQYQAPKTRYVFS